MSLFRIGRIGRIVSRTKWNTFSLSRSFSSETEKKTALYDLHVELGGKMVPFAGYLLPVQYSDGVINSHLHCRKSCSLFDVSHMGQLRLTGKNRLEYLETLVPSDLFQLKANQGRLSVLTNQNGGIIDDCVITNRENHVYMVVNAGCKDKDIAHMKSALSHFNSKNKSDVKMEYIQDRSLLALQGPYAASVLSRHIPSNFDISKLEFMYQANIKVDGIDCIVTRCGYTGEDGFEISVPSKDAITLMQNLLKNKEVLAAGLGVRDSLRLEAGLCLYGHELNESISPVEAQLSWLIGKRRKEKGGFLGHANIMKIIQDGPKRKRVGLIVSKGAPAREETEIQDTDGLKIGHVTSGTFSPSLKKAISMGYVSSSHAEPGTKISVVVRGKPLEAEIVKIPFVPTNYYKINK